MPQSLLAGAIAILSMTLACVPAAAVPAACTLHKILGVPVRVDRSLGLVVSAVVDRAPVALVVDTAKGYSALTLPFTERADVALASADITLDRGRGRMLSHTSSGFGRQALGALDADDLLDETATVDDLVLGDAHTGRARMAVLAAGGDGSDQRPAGFIGADYFLLHDVEFDAADGVLNIFDPLTCAEPPVYWSASFGSLAFSLGRDRGMTVEAVLDGVPLRALIDTGSSVTTMPLAVAQTRFPEASATLDPLPARAAFDGTAVRSFRGSFHRLEIGELSVRNPQVALETSRHGAAIPTGSHLDASQRPELVIGVDILRKLRSIIAYGDRRIYYTIAEPTLL